MITYSKIGKKGNLGNQLFQIASTIGIAQSNKMDFGFLPWTYQHYFEYELPLLNADLNSYIECKEQHYYHYDWSLDNNYHYDLSGWLQSEKYFNISLTKHYFTFKKQFVADLRKKYNLLFTKKTLLISIRRGDFVDHPDYFQIPINYYMNSIITFFPDWESRNLLFLSDDVAYCKFHFSFLENAFFADGLNAIEQLCIGAQCDDFIISNSTFSWWIAWLGEKENSKVIRPLHNFSELKGEEINDKDYFPHRWTMYNHINNRIKLQDVLFKMNFPKAEHLKKYITHFFDTSVEVDLKATEIKKATYIFNKDYFLPPFLIYVSCLKIADGHYSNIVNVVKNNFKVSQQFNYRDFIRQSDYGLFSKIFTFSEKKKDFSCREIYLSLSSNRQAFEESLSELEISCHVGQFCKIGGYQFSLLKFISIKKSNIKRIVKQLLTKN